MNNFELIQNMKIDEFAEFLASEKPRACFMCTGQEKGCLRMISCKQGIKEWLNKKVEK